MGIAFRLSLRLEVFISTSSNSIVAENNGILISTCGEVVDSVLGGSA